jgi:uncharacterized protein (TIGR02996 family)
LRFVAWNRVDGPLAGFEAPPLAAGERELLDAVLAQPTDDAPREVYADWLQQRGDVRGELIAIELACARATDVGEHNRLKRRDFALLEQHGHRWCASAGLGGIVQPWRQEDWYVEFERGFIERVELRADLLPQVATRLFGREPVRMMALRYGDLARLPTMVHLARLHTLILRNNQLRDAGLVALAASPHVGNLVRLDVDANGITDAAIPALASLRVHTLALRGNELTDAGAVALAATMPQLRFVSLEGNRIRGPGALALADLPHLVELDVAGNPIDAATWTALRVRLGDRVTR